MAKHRPQSTSRESRLDIRLDAARKAAIARAVQRRGETISEFILEIACQAAAELLVDERTVPSGWLSLFIRRIVHVAAVTEQADGGVSEGRQILGSVATLDLALVFAEGHVAHPVQAFRAPVGSPAAQQQGRIAGSAREAGDGVLHLDLSLALTDGRALQAADLSQTGPVEMFGQASAGLKMPLYAPSMPFTRGAGFGQRLLALLLGRGRKSRLKFRFDGSFNSGWLSLTTIK